MGASNKVTIEPSTLTSTQSYKLLTGMIVPRPIAWVTTVGKGGTYNAAPYSFFTALSTVPPIIGFSVGLRNGRKKDTLKNIEYSKDFVVNVVTEDLKEKMNVSAVDFPEEVDEIQEANLTAMKSEKVKSPMIAESPINFECKVLKIMILGKSRDRFIIGEIVHFHVARSILFEYKIDFSQLRALGRLAGATYCRTTHLIELPRL
jgi:flavin reductase (DIM6/NTAB) family NADH-FMN oxidoreductase RutF